jgi:hypothetical protein
MYDYGPRKNAGLDACQVLIASIHTICDGLNLYSTPFTGSTMPTPASLPNPRETMIEPPGGSVTERQYLQDL